MFIRGFLQEIIVKSPVARSIYTTCNGVFERGNSKENLFFPSKNVIFNLKLAPYQEVYILLGTARERDSNGKNKAQHSQGRHH